MKPMEREDRYRQALEASNAAILQFDTEGTCVLSNVRAAAFLAMTPAEMVGKTLWELGPHDIADARLKLIRRIAETGCGEDGEIYIEQVGRHFLRIIQPVSDDQEIAVGVLTVMYDISEQKRAESEAARFGRVLDESLHEIYIFDSETHKFVIVNRGARANLGYSIEELRDLSPTDIKPEFTPESFMELLEPLRTGKQESIEFTTVHRRKDGTEYPVDVRLQLSAEDPPAFVAMVVDSTERIRAEKARAEIASQMRQQQKLEAIGTLAGGVAHEINNPMTAIMNFAQLIAKRLEPESPLRDFALGISHEGRRVSRIVRSLLSFARLEEESYSPANIVDIVNETVSLVGTIIRQDQITLAVDVPDDLPKIECRSQHLQQVLVNLLTNARDALNHRYPEHDPDKIMNLSAQPFEREDRQWLRITVEDHGAGIPDKIRDKIFDPFFSTKDRTQGTGLGLSISNSIVRDHHGELRMVSEPGVGTRFQVELPVDRGRTLDGAQKR